MNTRLYIKTFLYLLCFVGLLHGCGFHLAGTGEFSSELDKAYVQGPNTSKELERFLKKNLRANQINVVEEAEATAIINLQFEETERVVLTLDSDGKAREFELILNVTFDVKKPDNSVLLKQQKIVLNRDFVFDKSDLLGANEEEQQLYSEMRNDAARLIVYRLQKIQ